MSVLKHVVRQLYAILKGDRCEQCHESSGQGGDSRGKARLERARARQELLDNVYLYSVFVYCEIVVIVCMMHMYVCVCVSHTCIQLQYIHGLM